MRELKCMIVHMINPKSCHSFFMVLVRQLSRVSGEGGLSENEYILLPHDGNQRERKDCGRDHDRSFR